MYFFYKDFKLYYEKYGNSNKKIVILPGWGDTRNTFTYMIDFLKPFYTVYIIDYPGFGNSNFPPTHLTIYDYADLIREFIYENDLQNAYLLGHSFGGRLIIILSGYYNNIYDKIVLIDSAGIKPKKSIGAFLRQKLYKFLKRLNKFLPKNKRTKYLNKLLNIFGSTDYKNLNPYMRKTFSNIVNEDLTPYLKNIKNEVLLLWGNKDIDTPLKDAYKMNKTIKESSLIVLPGTHYIYLENAYLINNILYEYFK